MNSLIASVVRDLVDPGATVPADAAIEPNAAISKSVPDFPEKCDWRLGTVE